MKLARLRSIILECCNDVVFTFNGLKSGVTSEVEDSVPTFQVWHGNAVKEYSNVDDLLSDKFFSGKNLIELSNEVELTFV